VIPETEAALARHPAVAAAAVVGIPDALRGQGLYAFVVPRPGFARDDGIADWVAAEAGPLARPDVVQWVDGLPRDRAGTLQRRVLRKIAEGEPDRIGSDAALLADPDLVARLVAGRVDRNEDPSAR